MGFIHHPAAAAALALSERLADTARAIAAPQFRAPVAVARKADGTPVTAVDRDIEIRMREMIRAEFPAHAVRGEEFAAEGSGEFTWVLDPIDGTKSFITGFALFGTLIALCQAERPVLGVIEAPALAERWVGCEGRPTRFDGHEARSRDCRTLAEAVVYTTTPQTFRGAERECFEALSARAALCRFGGDCYLFGMLASGHCDLVVEVQLKPHDYLAVIPVVQGAGGWISDWHGAPLTLSGGGTRVVAAGSEALWHQALEVLSRV